MRNRDDLKRRIRRKMDGKSNIWVGAFIVLVGTAALAKIYVPDLKWLFSWQTFLIALGIFFALRSKFTGGQWLIPIMVGTYFLINEYFVFDPAWKKMFWPMTAIAFGIFLIFRPKKQHNFFCSNVEDLSSTPPPIPPLKDPGISMDPGTTEPVTNSTSATTNTQSTEGAYLNEEILDIAAVFGAVKKNIYSKNFKGGEIVSVFGGAEVNLTQAKFIPQQIEIESVQVFGGAKLIIPADWTIHNEAVAIFGGIEDKRPQPIAIPVPEKVLVLKGFVMFGGIEIKSY